MRLAMTALVILLAQSASAASDKCSNALLSEDGEVSPFFHFEWTMAPAIAKRICGRDFEQDHAAIRRYYREIHGCSTESDVGSDIEAVLTYDPADDLLVEFGVSDRHAVPEEKWRNFCSAAEKISLEIMLLGEVSESSEIESHIDEFVLAIEMMQTGER